MKLDFKTSLTLKDEIEKEIIFKKKNKKPKSTNQTCVLSHETGITT